MNLNKSDRHLINSFYINPVLEDKDSATEYLVNAGINPEEAKNDFIDFLNDKKAAYAMKKGELLQKKFDEALNSSPGAESGEEQNGESYSLAARNFEGQSEEDLRVIKENLKALKKIKGKKKK